MNLPKNKLCSCGEEIEEERIAIGYYICIECGEERARRRVHTLVPTHKGGYVVISNKNDLKALDPKHRM